ncbi:MAG: DinB family protein [Acidobacteria bacterium]|nr:DinB family protein [Acidobacteriota bacterium]
MKTEELLIAATLASWERATTRLDKAFSACTDEDLEREIAPGSNRLRYLLGHLTAVHDRMLPLLDLGARAYPHLDIYLDQADRSFEETVTPAALRQAWSDVNARLAAGFATLQAGQWLERHTSVSPEDFAKEPLRNRFSVLLSRTNHAWSHFGQVAILHLEK